MRKRLKNNFISGFGKGQKRDILKAKKLFFDQKWRKFQIKSGFYICPVLQYLFKAMVLYHNGVKSLWRACKWS